MATTTETDELIATLRAALPGLRQEWPIRSLSLFGSRVRRDATPESDLDVLVDFSGTIDLWRFFALEERLSEITGLKVDLVSDSALKPFMGKKIRAEAVRL